MKQTREKLWCWPSVYIGALYLPACPCEMYVDLKEILPFLHHCALYKGAIYSPENTVLLGKHFPASSHVRQRCSVCAKYNTQTHWLIKRRQECCKICSVHWWLFCTLAYWCCCGNQLLYTVRYKFHNQKSADTEILKLLITYYIITNYNYYLSVVRYGLVCAVLCQLLETNWALSNETKCVKCS